MRADLAQLLSQAGGPIASVLAPGYSELDDDESSKRWSAARVHFAQTMLSPIAVHTRAPDFGVQDHPHQVRFGVSSLRKCARLRGPRDMTYPAESGSGGEARALEASGANSGRMSPGSKTTGGPDPGGLDLLRCSLACSRDTRSERARSSDLIETMDRPRAASAATLPRFLACTPSR